MRDDARGGTRPQVYARLSAEAEVRNVRHRPPRGTRLVGLLIVAALCATVAFAVFEVNPW